MKIIRATHLGMCFGVRDAIALAVETAAQQPVTVLGQLVHNETVLGQLRRRGVQLEDRLERVETDTVMITAHGASEKAMSQVRARGLRLLEATCPLVHVAHAAVQTLVKDGYHPIVIGQRDHVEVRGLTEDLADFDVVLSEADVARLKGWERIGIAAQTTQPIAKVEWLVSLIQRRFPTAEVRFVDTVCQPTKLRQKAAVDLARQCTVVIVIGGANSNNTRELVDTCRRHCGRVQHVQTASDLLPDWFEPEDIVGVTAGTSTPDDVIQGILQRLEVLARDLEPVAV